MTVDSGPFPQSALDENKNGRLTESQRQLIRSLSRGVRKTELSIALLSAAFGVVVFITAGPGASILVRVGIPAGCLALTIFLVLRAISGDDKLTRDLRQPQVESLAGPISKYSVQTHGGSGTTSSTTHYLRVAGQPFKVGLSAYQAAPDAGFVQVFFLSISRHVVNLERLADRPLPDGTTPQTLAQTLKQTVLSHDRSQYDELRAEVAGTQNALDAVVTDGVAPPAAASRDQRPLAEAILGTWSNGPVRAAFSENGSFSLTILGANERTGHWSVNGDGKLVADLSGYNQSTDAWIQGDQLTVSLGGSMVTLTRAPS